MRFWVQETVNIKVPINSHQMHLCIIKNPMQLRISAPINIYSGCIEVKVKVLPITGHEGPEGE
jgi:hypothetical protein